MRTFADDEIAIRDSVAALLPRVLPAEWAEVEARADGRGYRHATEPWTVILGVELHPHPHTQRPELWLHCSTARADRLPTWDELTTVRDVFLGRETLALQVLAPAREHVNIHPHCLHLWVPVGRRLTPDFTRGAGTI